MKNPYPMVVPPLLSVDKKREYYLNILSELTEKQRKEWDSIVLDNKVSDTSPNFWCSLIHYYKRTMGVLKDIQSLHMEYHGELEDVRGHVNWAPNTNWRERWIKANGTLMQDIYDFNLHRDTYSGKDGY
jgi:hypothetical protein